MSGVLEKGRGLTARLYKGSRQPRWAMASQVVTSGANFATALIIVRGLGLEEFGRFSVCFLLMMIARNFLNGLVLAPMSAIAPKLRDRTQAEYRGFLAANGMAFSLGSSVLLFALAVPLGMLLNAPWLPELALAMALANFTANGADFIRRYHFVQNAPIRAFAVDAIRFAVQLGLLLGLALYWQDGFSANTALHAMTLGGLAGFMAGMLHYGIVKWSSRLSRAVWPRHWNFIKWMTPGVALEAIQSSGVLLAGGALLGEAALGGVRAMQNLANTINLPANALQQIAPGMASAAYAKGGMAAMRTVLRQMTLGALLVVLSIIAVVIVLAEPLIAGLFGLSSAENLPVLLLFCIVNALIVLRLPLVTGLQSLERPEGMTASGLAGATAGMAGLFLLAGPAGALAIPLAHILVLAITYVLLAFFYRRAVRRDGLQEGMGQC